ncbi:DNA primase [Enterococcus canis]|nr:DNA primase [Enterococcus canis]
MAQIPQQVIDEVRSRSNIVDVIGQYVQLKKSGKNYMGLCPFHEERSPSFSVAEDKQIYHCFGCGKGGNVFTFLQDLEGISFPEAVQKVAEIEQIPVTIEVARTETVTNSTERELINLHEKTADLYHHILMNTKAGEEALAYLEERGLTKDIIETFKLGFAPAERTILSQVMVKEGFSEERLRESGLFVERENGDRLDRFYQRIMFPIENAQGKVVAFSGRLLKTEKFPGDDMPKYLNSPETEIFNKRFTLYNFARGRQMIRKESQVLLFEGFMDVIAAWQAGFQNGIASMGTSLTNEQLTMIERTVKEVVVLYDGDNAGTEATYRALQLLREHPRLTVSVVNLPEKLDPDEYVRKYGTESFRETVIHGKMTPFAFKMRYFRRDRNLKNEREQLAYLQDVLQALTEVRSPVERDMYLNQLAHEFQLSVESLQEQFQSYQQTARQDRQQAYVEPTQPQRPKRRVLNQSEKAEQMLLHRMFHQQSVRNFVRNQPDFHFIHDSYQELYLLLDSYIGLKGNFEEAEFIDFLQSNQLKQLVVDISLLNLGEESSEREITDLLAAIARSSIAEEITQKRIQQQEAGRAGNKALELQLTIDIINLTKQLKHAGQ